MNDHQELKTQELTELTDEERRWLIADPAMLDILDSMPTKPEGPRVTSVETDDGLPPDLHDILFGAS